LQAALAAFRQEHVEVILHCGDLTSPETAATLGEFRIIHTIGNGDYAAGTIRQVLIELNPLNYSGLVFTGEFEGISLAVTHGHLPGKVQELTESGLYQYVICGHSHRRKDEPAGAVRLINPGALGGLKAEERSACVLDLATGAAHFYTF
jgi:putative phosphoesterase